MQIAARFIYFLASALITLWIRVLYDAAKNGIGKENAEFYETLIVKMLYEGKK